MALFLKMMTPQKSLHLELLNIHYADNESAKFLSDVLSLVGDRSVFVIMTSSEEGSYAETFIQDDIPITSFSLSPLSQDETQRLMSHVIESGIPEEQKGFPIGQPLLEYVYSTSQGNAYFILELTRDLIRNEKIHRNVSGHWFLKEESDNESLPRSIDAVLKSRLDEIFGHEGDELSAKAYKVYAAAATLIGTGSIFELQVLKDLYDNQPKLLGDIRSETELARVIAHLESLGLITVVESRLGSSQISYRLTPPQMGYVTYETLLSSAKQALHQFYFNWFEKQADSQGEAHYEIHAQAAYHAMMAGLDDAAYLHFYKALERCNDLRLNHESLHFIDKSRAVLERSAAQDDERYLDLLLIEAEVYQRMNQISNRQKIIEKMENFSRENDSISADYRVRIATQRVDHLISQLNYEARVVHAIVAEMKELNGVTPSTWAMFYQAVGKAYAYISHPQDALLAYEQADTHAAESGQLRLRAQVLLGKASLFAREGKYSEVSEVIAEAVRIYEQTHDKYNIPFALITQADALMHLGRYPEAEELLVRARQLGGELNNDVARSYSKFTLATLKGYEGKYEEGLDVLEAAKRAGLIDGFNDRQMVFHFESSFLWGPLDAQKALDHAVESLKVEKVPPSYKATALFAHVLSLHRLSRFAEVAATLRQLNEVLASMDDPKLAFGDTELAQYLAVLLKDKSLSQLPEVHKLKTLKQPSAQDNLSPFLEGIVKKPRTRRGRAATGDRVVVTVAGDLRPQNGNVMDTSRSTGTEGGSEPKAMLEGSLALVPQLIDSSLKEPEDILSKNVEEVVLISAELRLLLSETIELSLAKGDMATANRLRKIAAHPTRTNVQEILNAASNGNAYDLYSSLAPEEFIDPQTKAQTVSRWATPMGQGFRSGGMSIFLRR